MTSLVSGHKHENIWERIGQTKIWEIGKKILGVEIDNSLKLDLHVSSLCKKARKTLSVLTSCVILSKTNINENLYRITVRLFPFGLNVSW